MLTSCLPSEPAISYRKFRNRKLVGAYHSKQCHIDLGLQYIRVSKSKAYRVQTTGHRSSAQARFLEMHFDHTRTLALISLFHYHVNVLTSAFFFHIIEAYFIGTLHVIVIHCVLQNDRRSFETH